MGSTLTPPALLLYALERSPSDSTTQGNTRLLRFLFGYVFQGTSDILLTSDPSPGWLPSAGLRVPFQTAGDERIIAINLQYVDNRGRLRGETFLIPTRTLLGQIESLPIKEGRDVDWESWSPQSTGHVPRHNRWDVWTCFVFGMRYILPEVLPLKGKPMIVVRDLCSRRCLRASEEDRAESNKLYQALTRGPHNSQSYPHSILKGVPLPEAIRDPQYVKFMISEDGIVALEVRHRTSCVFIAAQLMRLGCRQT